MIKKVLPPLFLIIASLNGLAQEVKKAWTLEECVNYALNNSLSVKRSNYNVKSNEINYTQSKWALVPTLNANLSNGYNWGRSVNPVTYEFVTQGNNSLNPNANSSVTLFNGLRLQNNIKQTSHDYQASREDLQKSKNDVILNIIQLYTNVIFNKEFYAAAESQLNASTQQLERIKKQVSAGALSRSNELNQEAQVASNELTLVNRENTLNFSLLQLKQALQLDVSFSLDVVVPEIRVEELVIDQSREEIFKIAYETMPEIKRDRLRIESSQYAVKAAKGNLYPRLSLTGSLNSNYASVSDRPRPTETIEVFPTIGTVEGTTQKVNSTSSVKAPIAYSDGYGRINQIKDNLSRSINFTLTIPILSGLQNRASVQRAVITSEISEITAQETSNTLRQSIETAYNDAIAASKTYSSSLKQVAAREEATRMTRQRFEAGAANYVESQIAENDLFQAKSDLVRAKYDFIFKKKLLDFYQGKPIGY